MARLCTSANLDVVKKRELFAPGERTPELHSARRLVTPSVMLNDPCSVDKEFALEMKLR
jgi:hypothetical protein